MHIYIYMAQLDICIKALKRGGVDINAKTVNGETAVHIACSSGNEAVLALLLDVCRAHARARAQTPLRRVNLYLQLA